MCSVAPASSQSHCCDSSHHECKRMCDSPVYTPCINPYVSGCSQNVRCYKCVCNPGSFLDYKFCKGIEGGMTIYICAKPKCDFDSFSINFDCGAGHFADIAFHFDVRAGCNEVVRNTRRNRNWGNEERCIPCFPFQSGVSFDMIIRIEESKYRVAVNGIHFIDYCHRMQNLCDVRGLMIEGDICISKFQVYCA